MDALDLVHQENAAWHHGNGRAVREGVPVSWPLRGGAEMGSQESTESSAEVATEPSSLGGIQSRLAGLYLLEVQGQVRYLGWGEGRHRPGRVELIQDPKSSLPEEPHPIRELLFSDCLCIGSCPLALSVLKLT